MFRLGNQSIGCAKTCTVFFTKNHRRTMNKLVQILENLGGVDGWSYPLLSLQYFVTYNCLSIACQEAF